MLASLENRWCLSIEHFEIGGNDSCSTSHNLFALHDERRASPLIFFC
jgi:hypothetical protein